MKMPKIKLPKFKKPEFRKPTVDSVLKWAQYGTYAYIVIRILMYGVQKLIEFKKKIKK
jgi:hypothetical protein